jgi:hypothetical protein
MHRYRGKIAHYQKATRGFGRAVGHRRGAEWWGVLTVLVMIANMGAVRPVGAQPSRGALSPGTLAIKNVAVVPVTSDIVLNESDVLLRDGRIAAVGPNGSVSIPRETRTIDGRGKYLIPGLADMHVHLFCDEEAPSTVASD